MLTCPYAHTRESQFTHTAKRPCMWFAGNGIGDEVSGLGFRVYSLQFTVYCAGFAEIFRERFGVSVGVRDTVRG